MEKKQRHKSTHHRRPRSRGGKTDQQNLSAVTDNEHRAWHTLFKNFTPYSIARIINNTWLDPEFYFIVKKQGENYENKNDEI